MTTATQIFIMSIDAIDFMFDSSDIIMDKGSGGV